MIQNGMTRVGIIIHIPRDRSNMVFMFTRDIAQFRNVVAVAIMAARIETEY